MYSNPGTKFRIGEKDILLITAGQPLDVPFPNWVQRSQLNKTEFQPYDAASCFLAFFILDLFQNFPLKIPKREFFKASYSVDTPLSQFGQHTSRVIGRQIVDSKFQPSCIYSCPSLKCLETSSLISSSFKTNPEICVEYGLWGEYGKIDAGLLITHEHAKKDIGFQIKRNYVPQIPIKIVDKCENWDEWQKRCVKTFETILKNNNPMVTMFVLDPLAMKTITAFCIYGENFGFNSDEEFLNLSAVPYGSCLLVKRNDYVSS
uniref:Uncharacterized protein n=1 Tax=Panagrolaimus sp. PS1159 TaxID=55785 RepID=A0AC35FGA8_9BILA